MATLKDTMAYIIDHYPHGMQHELSNARLTKMIYLADWHQAINYGNQITPVKWFFDNYGPYVNDVRFEAESNPDIFKTTISNNMYNQPKVLIELNDKFYRPTISKNEAKSFDHVIDQTKKMYWDSFIKLVYSTYPITNSERYSYLDLSQKASEYNKIIPINNQKLVEDKKSK